MTGEFGEFTKLVTEQNIPKSEFGEFTKLVRIFVRNSTNGEFPVSFHFWSRRFPPNFLMSLSVVKKMGFCEFGEFHLKNPTQRMYVRTHGNYIQRLELTHKTHQTHRPYFEVS
jgi:hypothetical protein